MNSYQVFKMSLEDILSDISPEARAEAETAAKEAKLEYDKLVTKNRILAIILIAAPVIFANIIIKGNLPDDPSGIIPLAFIAVFGIVFFGTFIRIIRSGKKIQALKTLSDPENLLRTLALQAKEDALNDLLTNNWLCPYCAASNSIGNTQTCSQCGKPYDKALTERYTALARKNKKLPPVVTME